MSADERTVVTPARSCSLLRLLVGPSWMQRRRMLRTDAWIILLGAYALTALGWLWPQNLRNQATAYTLATYIIFQFWTFAWHVGLVVLSVGAIAAVARQWRIALTAAPLAAILLCPELQHFLPKTAPPTPRETVTIVSVNLLHANRHTEQILAQIRQAQPDLLLLEEYSEHWHEAIQQSVGSDFPHVRHAVQNNPFGAAIYSRRPFVGQVRMDLPLGVTGTDTPQMRAVVEIAGRPVAIYHIHLLPPYGLWYAAKTREQLADLLDALRTEPLPVILAGDFNFTDRSPNAAALHEAGFVDTHALAGFGRGSTWPVHNWMRHLSGIRLDHIYLRGGLICAESRTGEAGGSDHRPIIARIGLEN